MASSRQTQSLRDEVTCSICLEYFTDPVCIECGHNFCRACISRCWAAAGGPGGARPLCPQCRAVCTGRALHPNVGLRNIAEVIRVSSSAPPAPPEAGGLCPRHQQRLQLFCETDLAPICVVCDRSQEHRWHNVIPVEEAGPEYKIKVRKTVSDHRRKTCCTRDGPLPSLQFTAWEESCSSTLDMTALEGFRDAEVGVQRPQQAGPRAGPSHRVEVEEEEHEEEIVGDEIPDARVVVVAPPPVLRTSLSLLATPSPQTTAAPQVDLQAPGSSSDSDILSIQDLEPAGTDIGGQFPQTNAKKEDVGEESSFSEESSHGDVLEGQPTRCTHSPTPSLPSPAGSQTVTVAREEFEGLQGRLIALEQKLTTLLPLQHEERMVAAVEGLLASHQVEVGLRRESVALQRDLLEGVKQSSGFQKASLGSLEQTWATVRPQGVERRAAEKRLWALTGDNTAAVVASTDASNLVGATISNNIGGLTLVGGGPTTSGETSQTSEGERPPDSSPEPPPKGRKGGRRK